MSWFSILAWYHTIEDFQNQHVVIIIYIPGLFENIETKNIYVFTISVHIELYMGVLIATDKGLPIKNI